MSEVTPPKGKIREFAAFVGSHKVLLMWPVAIFLVTIAVLVYLLGRSPAAPFVYR